MDNNKKTTLEELMGMPGKDTAQEEKKVTEDKFDLPKRKSSAGAVGIFILLFLLGGVSFFFYNLYTDMTTEKTKTSEEKIVESQELIDKQKLEAEKEATTTAASATQVATTVKELYSTAESGLNIRAEASATSEVAGSIPYGSKAAIISDDGTWLKVTYGGITGYSKKEFFTETAPAALSQ